jgi:hypothetical protein
LASYAGLMQADAYAGFNRLYEADRLRGDRRLVDPGQIEELAPGMGPTGGLDDRPSVARLRL